jgi:hypothetical protein
MSVLAKLLTRLHGVFDKDPQRTPVLVLTHKGNPQVSVSDLRLMGTEGLQIDLTELTLQGLVDTINMVPGYGASLTSSTYAKFLARGILEDGAHGVTEDPHLYYPNSLLWAEMQTYGWTLDEQSERLRQLTKQLYLHTADTDWLEYWTKDHFGKPKLVGETDQEYQRRAIQEIVAANQNNKALEILVEGALAGSTCDVIDSAADPDARLPDGTRPFTWFKVLVGFDLNSNNIYFDGKYDKAIGLITKGKAAGTRLEYLELSGHLTAATAKAQIGATVAMVEVIEILPNLTMTFEDDDDIITENGDDLMK